MDEEKGIEKGQAKSSRKHLYLVLQQRFGQLPDDLKVKIDSTTDYEILDSWFALALGIESLESFQSQIGL